MWPDTPADSISSVPSIHSTPAGYLRLVQPLWTPKSVTLCKYDRCNSTVLDPEELVVTNKTVTCSAVIVLLSIVGWAKVTSPVTVEIVASDSAAQAESRYQPSTLKCNNDGCTGGVGHSYAVVENTVHARAIINGEKVLLACGERRRKSCYVLPQGTYSGEIKGRSVWITSTLPATHENVKRRFDITGGW